VHGDGVPRDEALTGLPSVYQDVLEYLDAGWSHDDIARHVGIDPNAVEPLIALARAKLARAQQQTSVDGAGGVDVSAHLSDHEGDRT
jgi:DNA-directed RNA polymerase specialized sigma24 family protein